MFFQDLAVAKRSHLAKRPLRVPGMHAAEVTDVLTRFAGLLVEEMRLRGFNLTHHGYTHMFGATWALSVISEQP